MSDKIDPAKPDPKDEFSCPNCGNPVVWLSGPNAKAFLVEAYPTDDGFQSPFAGEMKYVHGQHEPHFCVPARARTVG